MLLPSIRVSPEVASGASTRAPGRAVEPAQPWSVGFWDPREPDEPNQGIPDVPPASYPA